MIDENENLKFISSKYEAAFETIKQNQDEQSKQIKEILTDKNLQLDSCSKQMQDLNAQNETLAENLNQVLFDLL